MEITTQMIKDLREATKAGVLDCRKALESSNGDYQKAVDFLREKGLATAAKRADRQASNGMVELYSHGNGRVGVMVEVNCETDFVARSEQFIKFAHEVALQVAAAAPKYIKEEDIPAEVLEHETEIAKGRAREEGKAARKDEEIEAEAAMKPAEMQAAEAAEQARTTGMEDELEDAKLLGESTLAKLAPTPKVEEKVVVDVEEDDDEQVK